MSNFCDETTVRFIGGKGGDGAVSFRKEKYVPRGGPDGGDGGNGGNIILIADSNINTLSEFNKYKLFKAQDGKNGAKKNMFGASGMDLVLPVPVGTIIFNKESGEFLADLNKSGKQFIVAKGGKGGKGNVKFKSSIHQAPHFAETGEEGREIDVKMELQLVADVGIIGFPSSGKSTLISVISNARPKIADYPFTTLIPNLGVVELCKFDKKQKGSFVVADIPGLIKGAHMGKGLGDKFLRHISRTGILVHLIDPTRNETTDFKVLNKELELFNKKLAEKEQIVVITKADLFSDKEIEKFKSALFKKFKKIKKIHVISAVTGKGVKDLALEMYRRISTSKKEPIIKETAEKVFRPHLERKKFIVSLKQTKRKKIFEVKGKRIEQIVKMTNLDNPEGLERIYHFLNKSGILAELKRQGADNNDKIKIAGKTLNMRR
jgi:GTP-binding protein